MRYRIRTEPNYRAETRYIAERLDRFLWVFPIWETLDRGDTEAEVQKAIDRDITYHSFKREVIKEIDA